MVKKYFWGVLCGLLLTAMPAAAMGFTYNYYKFLDGNLDSLLLSWGPFGTLENYNCDLNSYACAKTSQKNFSKNPDLAIGNDQAWYNPAKNLAIYKVAEKTGSEKIIRYLVSSFDQNQWSAGRQLAIADDIKNIYWASRRQNEIVYITAADAKSKKILCGLT